MFLIVSQCLYIGREQVIGLAFAVQVSEYTRRNCYNGRRCNQKSLFHDFTQEMERNRILESI